MQSVPSSLYSLARGCALAPGEVCGGVLAPAHDGFFPDFAADVRASFDEAEPMVDGPGEGDGPLASGAEAWRLCHVCCMYIYMFERPEKKMEVEKSKKTLKLTKPSSVFTPQQHSRNVRNASK